jgi:hypothetical protein
LPAAMGRQLAERDHGCVKLNSSFVTGLCYLRLDREQRGPLGRRCDRGEGLRELENSLAVLAEEKVFLLDLLGAGPVVDRCEARV